MKKLTAQQRLKVIDHLTSSDTAFDAGSILLDKNATEKEKSFGKLITDIYTTVHPHFGCKHRDWDLKTEKLLKKI